MNDRTVQLLKEIGYNKGKVINALIKGKVITTYYIVDAAIESKDNWIMYFVAKYVEGLDIESINKLAEKVKEGGLGPKKNYDVIYFFARDVKNAPVDVLADGLIMALNDKRNDGTILRDILNYIYKFIENVNEESKRKFADAIINLRWPYVILEFAEMVKGAPIRELALGIIETKNAECMYLFAKNIVSKNVPMDKLIDALIETKNAEYIYMFARDIKDAPIDKLEDGIISTVLNAENEIIESNNVSYICDFARDIKGADINKLIDAIVSIGSPSEIYMFAIYKRGDINRLAAGIVQTGSAEYIYNFARNIEDAPIDVLVDGIIATGDAKYMYDFIVNIKGAPINRLVEAIMNTRSLNYMRKVQKYLSDKNGYVVNSEEIITVIRTMKEERETFSNLIDLANSGEIEKISSDATLYRNLFIDGNINHDRKGVKTRTLVCENNGGNGY